MGQGAVEERGVTRVTIQFCEVANYRAVAEKLARAIREEFRDAHVEVELVPAKGGVYEVSVDGTLIFSKRATWRIPDSDEIFYHVRAALARGTPAERRGEFRRSSDS